MRFAVLGSAGVLSPRSPELGLLRSGCGHESSLPSRAPSPGAGACSGQSASPSSGPGHMRPGHADPSSGLQVPFCVLPPAFNLTAIVRCVTYCKLQLALLAPLDARGYLTAILDRVYRFILNNPTSQYYMK